MRIVVYGLWHLGTVTAACLARAGHSVVGLDPAPDVVAGLNAGKTPVAEPGLTESVTRGLASGKLTFTNDAAAAFPGADALWVTFDTPVDERDEADPSWVRDRLDAVRAFVPAGTLVVVSSQVPVGFTRALQRDWQGHDLRFAYSPENLLLGKAIESFECAERVLVGMQDEADRPLLAALFAPFSGRIEWMTLESAEMAKHALNAYLATSVAFINELARLCERVGANASDVARGLKSDGRIGPRAYLAPGGPFAGGTLARDLRFLAGFGARHQVPTPLVNGVLASNVAHQQWLRERLDERLHSSDQPVAAVLGLTYKAGTSTLRRSESIELCLWLRERGARVQVHDPAVTRLPDELSHALHLCASPAEALAGADVVLLATEWPEYRDLSADEVVRAMRHAAIVDPAGFLAPQLSADPRIVYVAAGRPPAA
jgi:UDPglucose 6-dehydrogenase